MSDLIGQQLGNYRLTRLLGRGGFAEVYLGEHVRLNMQAAIKILHANLSEEEVANFQHEAQVIAELTHPNIIRVLDFDIQQNKPFLVLDYAPAGSLRQHHPKGTRVPLNQVVNYVKQVAAALQFAHDRKLIHRDIKPENMLVGRQNEILLSDFGIVAIAHSTSSMSTQSSMGTIPYMAPEQIQAYPRPASDQYSLAVVAYQWLSGDFPFQGSTTEIIVKHLSVPPAPLHEKVPDLSPEVEQVILTALAKDPKDRFGSVKAFANALEQASKHGISQPSGTVDRQSGPAPKPSDTGSRNDVDVHIVPDTSGKQARIPYDMPVSQNVSQPDTSSQHPIYTPPPPPPPPPVTSWPQPVPYPTTPTYRPTYSYPTMVGQTHMYLPIPLPNQQGRHKFAFFQGLLFGGIPAGIFFVLSLISSSTGESALTETISIIALIILLSFIISYFFAGMRTARRTMSLGMALMASFWVTFSIFLVLLIITSINNKQAFIVTLFSCILVSIFIGLLGLCISTCGGLLGRSLARKAAIREATQTQQKR